MKERLNILFVTLYPLELNTSVSISSIGIIRGLLQLGHKLTIMMPVCTTDNDIVMDDVIAKCKVMRIPGTPIQETSNKIFNKFRRKTHLLDNTRGYMRSIQSISMPQEYFDVVLSVSDPKSTHAYVKRLLAKGLQYGRWIQHWGDPLLGDITRKYWYPNWMVRCYEEFLMTKADKIVYVSPFTYEVQQREHPNLSGRLLFVPLPIDGQETHTEHSESKTCKIVYLGDYSPSFRNLCPFYNACLSMPDIDVTIAGHGCAISKDNIKVLPRIPQKIAALYEADADIIVSVGNIKGTQIPGKIYYKAATDKHILVIIDGDRIEDMETYVKSFNRYYVCRNNEDSISNAIEYLSKAEHKYTTPERLLPVNIAKEILA